MNIYNLISFIGIFILLLLSWGFSRERKNINWRLLFWGLGLQFIFAIFIFWSPVGMVVFDIINRAVIKLFSFAKEGAYFLFGPLAVGPGEVGPGGMRSLGFILIFQVLLPTIVFFSSLMAILYYLGIMQKVIRGFATVFSKLMRISGAESLCAASNIFVGIESALTIRPFIDKMTNSELCTILTAGMATIASTVLALYAGILKTDFPNIAGHLVSASVLSAPAAIMMSKLLYPESKKADTIGRLPELKYQRPCGLVEAIINGAYDGLKLCVGIIALLLAFLGLLAMLNWILITMGNIIGNFFGISLNLSLQNILAHIFYLFALIIGVPFQEAAPIATLLGERTIVTELVAYQHLAQFIKSGVITNPRSVVLASYALCGFAHIASLAIFVGGISAIVPNRSKDLARLGPRALFAAILACLLTACIAGVFFVGKETILFQP